MDTKQEPPEAAIATVLGSVRESGYSMRITQRPSLKVGGHTFAFALIVPKDPDRPFGTVTVTPTGAVFANWDRDEAPDQLLLPGNRMEHNLVRTCRALSEALRDQTLLPAWFGFRPSRDCPAHLTPELEDTLS